MEKDFYISIVDAERFYGNSPFKTGDIVKIVKNHGNGGALYDMRATIPMLGTVGRVARKGDNLAEGTVFAEEFYKKIGDFAYAQIMFTAEGVIIGKILLPKEVKRTPYVKAYRKRS